MDRIVNVPIEHEVLMPCALAKPVTRESPGVPTICAPGFICWPTADAAVLLENYTALLQRERDDYTMCGPR